MLTNKKKINKTAKRKRSSDVSGKVHPVMWKHSFMTCFYADGELSETSCQVRISRGGIAVSYADEGEVVYEGTEDAPGHFRLACKAVNGRATLHRFPDGDMLEGFWTEGGNRGMWRIQLNDDAE
jgi:hypothetical protein